MKKIIWISTTILVLFVLSKLYLNVEAQNNVSNLHSSEPKISLAYVESGRSTLPDPNLFSHLIYAFCEFNDANDGVVLSNPKRLRALSDLKNQNKELKVMLGIGGYKKEGFSEMAGDKNKRKAFIQQCQQIINDYQLDGIDLDWEFPGTTAGGHTASPKDSKNYVTLVKELRKSLGKDKWISFYSNNSGKWIDFKKMLPYVDYVNVSGYNLSTPHAGSQLYHQSALYPSRRCGNWCVSKSIERHLELGVPAKKILLGMPFFGRGLEPFPNYVETKAIEKYADGCRFVWDTDAQAPYYVDRNGTLVVGFDNEQSLNAKCDFIRNNGLAGGFIWNYDADYDDHRLAKTLQKKLLKQ